MYKVIQTIQSRELDSNVPVEVQFYSGESLVQAMSALVMAVAPIEEESKFYTILGVRLDVV